jgi:hypothetical protein
MQVTRAVKLINKLYLALHEVVRFVVLYFSPRLLIFEITVLKHKKSLVQLKFSVNLMVIR